MTTPHVLSMTDLSAEDVRTILDLSERADLPLALEGIGAALLFEHPSARTRNAAEMAVFQLGGHPVTIRGEEVGLDVRESVEDVARTLGGYHSIIGARVAKHTSLERMVHAIDEANMDVAVVNLLSDHEHPTQALADLLTMRQSFGSLEGRTLTFVGDGNNVARSLAYGCALAGVAMRISSPVGYALNDEEIARCAALGGTLEFFEDPKRAAQGADVLYTDVWISMGEEDQREQKRSAFKGFGIDASLLGLANIDAIVLHCLPAHRGEEISAEVMDGPKSRVWAQAANRMHVMRGLFAHLRWGARNAL